MEITVVDDSDIVGFVASATRESEIYMRDVSSLVKNVLAEWTRRQPYRRVCSPSDRATLIARLNVLDHGNANGLQLGDDWIDSTTLPNFEVTLRRLRPALASGGLVHLQHCQVGSNRALMLKLAELFGVDVVAGTGDHNPVYRFNFGEYARATPGGTYTTPVSRP